MEEVVMQFGTGAIRGHKEIPTRWDLLSLIALQEVAHLCKNHEFNTWKEYSPLELVGYSIESLMLWMGGKRDQPFLPIAFRHLMFAIQIRENPTGQIDEIRAMQHAIGTESTGSTGLQWLSHSAIKHLASTLDEGQKKYCEWNWLSGFPIQNPISHALDHLWAISNAHNEEDDWGHALWNIMVAIHFEKTRPDLMRLLPGDFYQITDELAKMFAEQRAERMRVAAKEREDEARGLVNSRMGQPGAERVIDGHVGNRVGRLDDGSPVFRTASGSLFILPSDRDGESAAHQPFDGPKRDAHYDESRRRIYGLDEGKY